MILLQIDNSLSRRNEIAVQGTLFPSALSLLFCFPFGQKKHRTAWMATTRSLAALIARMPFTVLHHSLSPDYRIFSDPKIRINAFSRVHKSFLYKLWIVVDVANDLQRSVLVVATASTSMSEP